MPPTAPPQPGGPALAPHSEPAARGTKFAKLADPASGAILAQPTMVATVEQPDPGPMAPVTTPTVGDKRG